MQIKLKILIDYFSLNIINKIQKIKVHIIVTTS